MNKLINTVATLGLAAGLTLASTGASAQLDFTIDESVGSPFPGAGLVTADLINGAYQEQITFTSPCGAGCLNFSTTAIATFSQLTNNGAPVASLLSASPSAVPNLFNYGMYALFESVGQVTAGPGGPTFTGNTGSISLYLDPGADNAAATVPPNGLLPFGVNDTDADDQLLATASMLTNGEGSIILGTGGFFDLIWRDFTLTAAGESVFVAPDPFHLIVNVDGDFNEFDPFNPANGPTQFLTGDVSAVFLVPEPTTLALMGASLIGFGAARRNKK